MCVCVCVHACLCAHVCVCVCMCVCLSSSVAVPVLGYINNKGSKTLMNIYKDAGEDIVLKSYYSVADSTLMASQFL